MCMGGEGVMYSVGVYLVTEKWSVCVCVYVVRECGARHPSYW